MRLEPIEITDRIGRKVILRSAETSDAGALIEYMKTVTTETPFLIREPGEFCMTIEQEEHFIASNIENPKALMLIAEIDGIHIGNCSLAPIGSYRRYAHRCDIAIALYQKYCATGIGRMMLNMVLEQAKKLGYEQAELEVISTNENAVHLYESLGFTVCGTFPNNMKYVDGTYADAFWMMKKL